MDELVATPKRASPTRVSATARLAEVFADWNALLERLPIGVYVCDAEGVVTHYNRRAAELWGRAPEAGSPETRFCGSLRLHLPDGRPLAHQDCPMAVVLATGEPFRDGEVVVERPDGSRVDALANIEPLTGADGALVGAVNCFQDISELKRARGQIRQIDAWVWQVVDRSPVAIYWTDAEGRLVRYNQAAAKLWGREPVIGEDFWCGSHKLSHPDGRPMPLDECPMATALKTGAAPEANEAIFERPDGSRGAFLAYPTVLRGADDSIAGAVNMLVDISERKQAEERQKGLLDELNHRVKNTLASVQSLAAHSLRGDGDPLRMRQDFEARLVALSNAHNRLADGKWEVADLRDLVADVLAPYDTGAVRIEGPPARVEAKAAVTLCMALHELATNAVKYGSLSQPGGRLSVSWETEPGRLRLDWREEGGPAVSPPARQGFGTRFVAGAVRGELGGEIAHEFPPEGVRCRIEAPL